ncbi:MAG TPA: hypothetical protein VHB21_06305 [Minicystis sp.]|nr:hypothetical protein [Minicystis sp.]
MRRALAASTIALVAACGARSSLFEGEAARGGGGGTTTSSSSTTGTGGATSSTTSSSASSSSTGGGGGGGVPCVLAVTGPDTAAPDAPGFQSARPALVSLGAATPPVALVEGLDPLETPGPPRSILGVVGLDPWSTWPPALAMPTSVVSTSYGSRFSIATSIAGTYAVLADRALLEGEGGGLAFATDATASGAATFSPLTSTHDAAAFIDTSFPSVAPAVLSYWTTEPSGGLRAHVEAFADAGEGYGCGAPPLPAAAAASGGALLAAFATQDDLDVCLQDPPPVPGTNVETRSIRPGTNDWNVEGGLFAFSQPVLDVAMSPREGGAWLAALAGAGPALGGSVHLQALDAGAQATGVNAEPDGSSWGAIAAAPFGDGLLLVALDVASSQLVARLFDASGALVSQVTVPLAFPEQPIAPITLVAGPSGREWLLAWPAIWETGSDAPNSIHLARLACVPPPP